MPHLSSRRSGFAATFLKKSIWSRLVQSKFSTASGLITSKLYMNCVPQARVAPYSISLRIRSIWWKQYQRESSNHCKTCWKTICNTCLSIAIQWSPHFLACTKLLGEAIEGAPPKLVILLSWTISSRTSL